MTTAGSDRRAQWPMGGEGPFPPLLAVFGAALMAIGSISQWANMVTDNEMDTDIYPVIRGVMIACAFGYLVVALAMSVHAPWRLLVAAVLGLGSLGALLGCLAFIAIGQVGYHHNSGDVVCAAGYFDCGPELTLYDPDVGILLIVLGSFLTGGVALWVLLSWMRWINLPVLLAGGTR